MEVAFDANGYPYDTSTGLLVNLTYDADGNAIDGNTGDIIDTVIPPDKSTVYQTSTTPISQIIQAVAAQLGRPPQVGYYPPSYPQGYPGTYPSNYPPGYRGGGVQGSIVGSSQGVGGSVTLSPTVLLIGGVVLFAFLFGRRR